MRIRAAVALVLLHVVPISARAQQEQRARTATIQGDVYLVMRSGDTKRGAGLRVALVTPSTPILDNVRAMCRSRDSTLLQKVKKLELPDSAALASVWETERKRAQQDLSGILLAYGQPVFAKTGINAHYRFSGVRPGSYLIYSEWTIGDMSHVWLTTASVGAGESITVDLDNEAVEEDKCWNRRWK